MLITWIDLPVLRRMKKLACSDNYIWTLSMEHMDFMELLSIVLTYNLSRRDYLIISHQANLKYPRA